MAVGSRGDKDGVKYLIKINPIKSTSAALINSHRVNPVLRPGVRSHPFVIGQDL